MDTAHSLVDGMLSSSGILSVIENRNLFSEYSSDMGKIKDRATLLTPCMEISCLKTGVSFKISLKSSVCCRIE